jgi:UDPglucose 6-dehydrogenase
MSLREFTLGIIGGGVVGHATARAFTEHCQVRVYDIVPEKKTHSLEDTLESDLIMVCLPTPPGDGGRLDTSLLEQFLESMSVPRYYEKHFVIRSTVPIGFTRLMSKKWVKNICHSPEFLTSRCAVLDSQMPSRCVVGMVNRFSYQILVDLYEKRYPHSPIHLMMSDQSETVKLIQNAFFATKIAFFNEMHHLCAELNLGWPTILNAILADGRIHPNHTQVPGPDGKYGFGGECLPKDLTELIMFIYESGMLPHVTGAALTRNLEDRQL